MYSTTALIYQQIQRILLIDTAGVGDVFDRRWEPVYAKKLTINKGVDNVIFRQLMLTDPSTTQANFVTRFSDRRRVAMTPLLAELARRADFTRL